jgi:hypothetical protein
MPRQSLLIALLCLAVSACGWLGGRATPTPAAPAEALRDFDCYGRANDLLAGALSLRAGGTANFNGQEGTWTYDAQAFSFSLALSLAEARLNLDTGELEASLRPGFSLPNAPDGLLLCRPR